MLEQFSTRRSFYGAGRDKPGVPAFNMARSFSTASLECFVTLSITGSFSNRSLIKTSLYRLALFYDVLRYLYPISFKKFRAPLNPWFATPKTPDAFERPFLVLLFQQ